MVDDLLEEGFGSSSGHIHVVHVIVMGGLGVGEREREQQEKKRFHERHISSEMLERWLDDVACSRWRAIACKGAGTPGQV